MSEANNPHFTWIPQWNYIPATKNTEIPFQPTCIAAIPIRSVDPTTEASNNSDFRTKPSTTKKKKYSAKSSNGLGTKQTKKKPSACKKSKSNIEKKNGNFDKAKFDFSGVPAPVCSCTGVARPCYKCGVSGWQSSCCNSSISLYPLPMSSSRPGARLCGRKMSIGAYEKLLFKLATEGYDLSHPVDLKEHWAKHGTNKFVTIK